MLVDGHSEFALTLLFKLFAWKIVLNSAILKKEGSALGGNTGQSNSSNPEKSEKLGRSKQKKKNKFFSEKMREKIISDALRIVDDIETFQRIDFLTERHSPYLNA